MPVNRCPVGHLILFAMATPGTPPPVASVYPVTSKSASCGRLPSPWAAYLHCDNPRHGVLTYTTTTLASGRLPLRCFGSATAAWCCAQIKLIKRRSRDTNTSQMCRCDAALGWMNPVIPMLYGPMARTAWAYQSAATTPPTSTMLWFCNTLWCCAQIKRIKRRSRDAIIAPHRAAWQ